MEPTPDLACILSAWETHEGELRAWLRRRLDGDAALADDLLQALFLKVIRQGERFCQVEHVRAWLFTGARNAVIDHLRVRKTQVSVPEELVAVTDESPMVDSLAACLPRALSEMNERDADILRCCDLQGQSQVAYAQAHDLSIPGAKSRLQRARRRLRTHLTEACQVRRDETGKVCCFVPCAPLSK